MFLLEDVTTPDNPDSSISSPVDLAEKYSIKL